MIGHIFSEGTYMFDLFIQCNIKILLVLVAFGFIMGRARQSAWRNFSKNARTEQILFLKPCNSSAALI